MPLLLSWGKEIAMPSAQCTDLEKKKKRRHFTQPPFLHRLFFPAPCLFSNCLPYLKLIVVILFSVTFNKWLAVVPGHLSTFSDNNTCCFTIQGERAESAVGEKSCFHYMWTFLGDYVFWFISCLNFI